MVCAVLEGSADTWIRKNYARKKKIGNAKKAKEQRCFKADDEQGSLWMLKAKTAEGLKKARKLDARTEPEPEHSRTQNSSTLQLN